MDAGGRATQEQLPRTQRYTEFFVIHNNFSLCTSVTFVVHFLLRLDGSVLLVFYDGNNLCVRSWY